MPDESNDANLERLKLKIDLLKWIIGSVALTLITFFFNWGLQERSQGLAEIKQYETHIELITQVENIARRRLLAQFFANVTASNKLRDGWMNYYKLVDKEYQDFIDSLRQKKEAIDTSTINGKTELRRIDNTLEEFKAISTQSSIVSKDEPKSIIYFQVTQQSLRAFSDSLVFKLNEAGYNAYGTEYVNVSIPQNRIIYYQTADVDQAMALKRNLVGLGLSLEVVWLKHLAKKVKPGTLEVWIKERK
jgi:hypothetical protein